MRHTRKKDAGVFLFTSPAAPIEHGDLSEVKPRYLSVAGRAHTVIVFTVSGAHSSHPVFLCDVGELMNRAGLPPTDDTVGQALDALRAAHGCSAQVAAGILSSVARSSGTALYAVARDVVSAVAGNDPSSPPEAIRAAVTCALRRILTRRPRRSGSLDDGSPRIPPRSLPGTEVAGRDLDITAPLAAGVPGADAAWYPAAAVPPR
jgi:hypothetical protein